MTLNLYLFWPIKNNKAYLYVEYCLLIIILADNEGWAKKMLFNEWRRRVSSRKAYEDYNARRIGPLNSKMKNTKIIHSQTKRTVPIPIILQNVSNAEYSKIYS